MKLIFLVLLGNLKDPDLFECASLASLSYLHRFLTLCDISAYFGVCVKAVSFFAMFPSRVLHSLHQNLH